MKVLVTGATGYIGSSIARSLIKQGLALRLLVRDPRRLGAGLEAAVVHLGDVGEPEAMAAAAQGCDAVVHAASEAIPRSDERVLKWVNIAGTENVINAARYAGCRRLIYLSCADVTLTNCDRLNWNEERRPDRPLLGAHARSKKLAEEVALASSTPAMEVVALRPAWVWGPGDVSVLPRLCQEAINEHGLSMCGSGRNYLATTYIDLISAAVAGALNQPDVAGKAYYITDLTQAPAAEFLQALSVAVGIPMPRKGRAKLEFISACYREALHKPGLAPSEVVRRSRHSLFDVQRAVKDLGITPTQQLAPGMRALKCWVSDAGGANGLARLVRPPKAASAVDAQVKAAGGDKPSELLRVSDNQHRSAREA